MKHRWFPNCRHWKLNSKVLGGCIIVELICGASHRIKVLKNGYCDIFSGRFCRFQFLEALIFTTRWQDKSYTLCVVGNGECYFLQPCWGDGHELESYVDFVRQQIWNSCVG